MKIRMVLWISALFCVILITQNVTLMGGHYDIDNRDNPSGLEREKLKQDLAQLEKNIKGFSLIFEKVAQLVGPSVVKINIIRDIKEELKRRHNGENNRLFPPFPKPHIEPFKEKEAPIPQSPDNHVKIDIGSGIIIDENGYIVTNYHVVHGASAGNIEVILSNGEKYGAEIIGTDPKTDLAVIKIDGKDLQKADFGDVSNICVGDWVIAIGSPFNYQQTVSAGIISAIGRKHVNPNSSPFAYEDFIQTDASVNPGSSGGPLVNLRGEIIGVNSAIATRSGGFQGISFAISSSIAKKVVYDLIKEGKVSRGHIGVGMMNINNKLSQTLGLQNCDQVLDYLGLESKNGAFIARVWNDTPASLAGIMPGDVIIEMDNIMIANSEDLQKVIRNKHVGSIAKVIIVREHDTMPVNIKIGEQPDYMDGIGFSSIRTGTLSVAFGLTVQKLTPMLADSLGYEEIENGIIVVEVSKDSAAEKAGLKQGDVITKIGYDDVSTIFEFYKSLDKCKKDGKAVTMQLASKGFVTLLL